MSVDPHWPGWFGDDEAGDDVALTDDQIHNLRAEATAAGDRVMAAVCFVALGARPEAVSDGLRTLERRDFERLRLIDDPTTGKPCDPDDSDTPKHNARAECARVIREAESR